MKFSHLGCETRPIGNCFSRPAGELFFVLPPLTPITNSYFANVSEEFVFFCVLHAHTSSSSPFVRTQVFGLCGSARCGLGDVSCVAMPPPSKRLHEVESWRSGSTASASKRIRGSASRAGFEADPVMNSHCFTWQNPSLKDPDDDNKQHPCRMSTLVESEPVSTPVRSLCGEHQ